MDPTPPAHPSPRPPAAGLLDAVRAPGTPPVLARTLVAHLACAEYPAHRRAALTALCTPPVPPALRGLLGPVAVRLAHDRDPAVRAHVAVTLLAHLDALHQACPPPVVAAIIVALTMTPGSTDRSPDRTPGGPEPSTASELTSPTGGLAPRAVDPAVRAGLLAALPYALDALPARFPLDAVCAPYATDPDPALRAGLCGTLEHLAPALGGPALRGMLEALLLDEDPGVQAELAEHITRVFAARDVGRLDPADAGPR